MLHTLTALERMTIDATDGRIGTIANTYFDDHVWTLRYLVAEATRWSAGRRVLIPLWSVREIDWRVGILSLDLSRERIRGGPSMDWDRPVTDPYERACLDYFGCPLYWMGAFRWGPVASPPNAGISAHCKADYWWEQQRPTANRTSPRQLRDTEIITGYRVEASDGAIGHIQDFLYEGQDWSLRFLAIDTRIWWPGHYVLAAIDWIERVDWSERKCFLSMPQEAMRHAPQWEPAMSLAAQDEDCLHDHGGRIYDGQPARDQRRH